MKWFCRAADKAYLTTEKIVDTSAFDDAVKVRNMPIERNLVAGVAEAPLGAHPTSNGPDYGIDVGHLKTYSQAAGDGWQDYYDTFVTSDNYIEAVGGEDHIRALPPPGILEVEMSFSLAELCIAAGAEIFEDETPEVFATLIGLVPRLAGSLAKSTHIRG